MARKVINVVYKVDDRELTKTKTAIQGVEKETKDAEKEMLKLDRAVKKTGQDGKKGMDAFGKAISLISVAAISASIFKLGKTIFDLGVKQEQLNIAFTTFLKSGEKAKKLIKELVQFAILTPFSPDQVNQAARSLLAFGFKAKEILPTLRMLGDVSAGTGKDLSEMAVIFGQIRVAGRLMGQDLLQLINAGFNPLQIISQKTGQSVRVLRDEMERGNISFEMVSEAFKTATTEGGLFFNLMEKQSKSVGGLLEIFSGNITEGFKNIYSSQEGPIADFIKQLVTLSEAFLQFTKSQAQLNDEVEASTIDKQVEKFAKYRDLLKQTYSAEIAQADAIRFVNLETEKRLRQLEKLKDAELAIINARNLFGDNVDVQIQKRVAQERLFALQAESDALKRVLPAIDNFILAETDVAKVVEASNKKIKKQKFILPELGEAFNTTTNLLRKGRDDFEKAGDKAYDSFLKNLDDQNKAELDAGLIELQNRKDILDEKIKLEEAAAAKKAANEQRAKEQAINNAAQLAGELASLFLMQREIDTSAIQDKYSLELELAGDNERAKKSIQKRQQDELKKVEQQNKEIQKKNAIANIGINTAQAIVKTFVQFGWPAGILPAALMAAIGVAQVANVRKFKDGEVNINGRGTSTSDSIPAMLSRGESVINAGATSRSQNLLEAINDRKIDDSILNRLSGNGGRQVGFDDSGIIRAIEKNKVDYITQGYSLYQTTQVGKNFKRTIRSKVQGY